MKWVLILVAVLAAIVLLVTIIGMLLPRGHVVSRKVTFRQPANVIFTAITDWQAFPAWREGVTAVKEWSGPAGEKGWTEVMKWDEIPLQILESTAPSKLVVKIANPKLPWGGTWTYDIHPIDDQTSTLTITENGEVYNPIFRFMAKFVMGHTMTMDAYLRSLGKKFGEEVKF